MSQHSPDDGDADDDDDDDDDGGDDDDDDDGDDDDGGGGGGGSGGGDGNDDDGDDYDHDDVDEEEEEEEDGDDDDVCSWDWYCMGLRSQDPNPASPTLQNENPRVSGLWRLWVNRAPHNTQALNESSCFSSAREPLCQAYDDCNFALDVKLA